MKELLKKFHIPTSQKKSVTESKKELETVILETIDMEQTFPLEITQEAWSQVKYLCKNIWEVEWSGVLFYDTVGEFGNKNFKCIAKYILPMNKGTTAYTEFETGDEIVKFLTENNEYLMCKQGLVHSHNNMGVFFSSTDLKELAGNTPNHNYYLSLIVNNKGECCAKIGSKGELNEEKVMNFTYTGEEGKSKKGNLTMKSKKEVIFAYNCDIKLPETEVDKYFKEQVVEICKPKFTQGKYPTYTDNKQYNHYLGKQGDFGFDKQPIWDNFAGEVTFKKPERVIFDTREEVIARFLNMWMPGTKDDFQDSLEDIKKTFRVMSQDEYDVQIDIFEEQMMESFEDAYKGFFIDEEMKFSSDVLQECIELMDRFTTDNFFADEVHSWLAVKKEEILEEQEIENVK